VGRGSGPGPTALRLGPRAARLTSTEDARRARAATAEEGGMAGDPPERGEVRRVTTDPLPLAEEEDSAADAATELPANSYSLICVLLTCVYTVKANQFFILFRNFNQYLPDFFVFCG
jgi:hypothetical protein